MSSRWSGRTELPRRAGRAAGHLRRALPPCISVANAPRNSARKRAISFPLFHMLPNYMEVRRNLPYMFSNCGALSCFCWLFGWLTARSHPGLQVPCRDSWSPGKIKKLSTRILTNVRLSSMYSFDERVNRCLTRRGGITGDTRESLMYGLEGSSFRPLCVCSFSLPIRNPRND